MMTSLIPVLDLDCYAEFERPLSASSESGNAQDRSGHGSQARKAAGVAGTFSWEARPWLVPLDQLIGTPILKTLARKALDDVDRGGMDELTALSGGFVLAHDDRVIFPGCCGDLGNLDDWRRAAASDDETWAMLWIGHPWTYFRAIGEMLVFAEPTEQENPDNLAEYLQLSRKALHEAIASATREIASFAERLIPLVEEFRPGVAAVQIVDILTHGNEDSEEGESS